MTQYEIIEKVPTGLKVGLYEKGVEIWMGNVPAKFCQTKSMLENYLRKIAADKTQENAIPAEVLAIRGRRPL